MNSEKIFIGILFIGLGLLFFFNNKNIGQGAYKFYQKLYTKENLVIIFKACGVILIIGGLLLIFIK